MNSAFGIEHGEFAKGADKKLIQGIKYGTEHFPRKGEVKPKAVQNLSRVSNQLKATKGPRTQANKWWDLQLKRSSQSGQPGENWDR